MSVMTIYEHAPIGAMIAWRDGTRVRRNATPIGTRNGYTATIAAVWSARRASVAAVTRGYPRLVILKGDFTEAGVVANSSLYTFSSDIPFRFTIVERPQIGSVRVFNRPDRDAELVYLGRSRAEAEHWALVEAYRYPDPVFEEVTADEVAAAVVEGRIA